MNTDTINLEKNIYLIRLDEQLEEFTSRLNSIDKKLESSDFPNESELGKKYKQLKENIRRFSWKINHLKESENVVGDLVQQSFNYIIDEIGWRMDGVELAMQGKQLWEAGDDLKRGKNRIQNLKSLSENR